MPPILFFLLPLGLVAVVGLLAGKRTGGASRSLAGCDLTKQGFSEEVADRINSYAGLAEQAAAEFGVETALVFAVIHTESTWSPKAESKDGAIGLMQIMPSTAKGIADQTEIPNTPWDPATNTRMGAWLLASLLDRWEDPVLALASYFAGSGNVKKALDGGYWPESYENYANAVMERWDAYEALIVECS